MVTLIVEDGTMPVGANSYASVEDCDSYQAARVSVDWPAVPESGDDSNLSRKEAALIKATDYLNGIPWKGIRAAAGRVMAWPRANVIDADGYAVADNVVPQNVIQACCYLAGIIYPGKVNLQPILERGGRIQSEKVSSLATSYFDDAANRDVYAAVADLLSGLASGLDQYAGVGDSSLSGGGFTQGKVMVD